MAARWTASGSAHAAIVPLLDGRGHNGRRWPADDLPAPFSSSSRVRPPTSSGIPGDIGTTVRASLTVKTTRDVAVG
jgi:hypothetical protein